MLKRVLIGWGPRCPRAVQRLDALGSAGSDKEMREGRWRAGRDACCMRVRLEKKTGERLIEEKVKRAKHMRGHASVSRCIASAAVGRSWGSGDMQAWMRATTSGGQSSGAVGTRHSPRRSVCRRVVRKTSSTPNEYLQEAVGCRRTQRAVSPVAAPASQLHWNPLSDASTSPLPRPPFPPAKLAHMSAARVHRWPMSCSGAAYTRLKPTARRALPAST